MAPGARYAEVFICVVCGGFRGSGDVRRETEWLMNAALHNICVNCTQDEPQNSRSQTDLWWIIVGWFCSCSIVRCWFCLFALFHRDCLFQIDDKKRLWHLKRLNVTSSRMHAYSTLAFGDGLLLLVLETVIHFSFLTAAWALAVKVNSPSQAYTAMCFWWAVNPLLAAPAEMCTCSWGKKSFQVGFSAWFCWRTF